jgi:hypothetical protein
MLIIGCDGQRGHDHIALALSFEPERRDRADFSRIELSMLRVFPERSQNGKSQ